MHMLVTCMCSISCLGTSQRLMVFLRMSATPARALPSGCFVSYSA
jgi:hypothetical protein